MRLTLLLCLSLLSLVRGAEDIPDINQQLLEDKEVLEAEETVQRQIPEERRQLDSERLVAAESSTQQPTVEYADDERKASQDTSAQTFVTPAPRLAKISDVLTTQGIPYPTAIANHLISPVSIYQSRLPATPAYDVSPPIQAQLAYSEHSIYQTPPQQNSVRYYPEQKPISSHGFLSRLPLNFNLQGSPQNLQYYQSVIPQQHPHLIRLPQQQVLQYQIPSLQYNQPQNLDQQRPLQYSQPQQQPLYNIVFNRHNNLPPGITYARPEENANDNLNAAYAQPQRLEKSESQGQSNQLQNNRQNIPNVDKSQGAVSYASFSQSPPSYVPQQRSPILQQAYTAQKAEPQNININLIPNDRLLPIQGAPFIFRTQQNVQNYQLQNIQQLPPVQQIQVQQIPHPVQHFPQQQLQYIPRHPAPGNLPPQSQQYLLQIPQFQQLQPLQQPQIYQLQPNYDPRPQQGYLIPEQQQRPQTAPNFLPVQYFGKFAEKIFARYNENEKK